MWETIKSFPAEADRRVLGVQDFFQKDCWKHHPKPHKEYMDWRFKEDEKLQMQRERLVPGNWMVQGYS
jgi:hypothetical protein